MTTFFSLDPSGLRPFQAVPEVIDVDDIEFGQLLSDSTDVLIGEQTMTLTDRRPFGADVDGQTDEEDATLASSETNGYTVLTESGELIVVGWAPQITPNHLVGWLATAAALAAVETEQLDAALGADIDLGAVYLELVGSEAPAHFAGTPRVLAIGADVATDVTATIGLLETAGVDVDAQTMTVYATDAGTRFIALDRLHYATPARRNRRTPRGRAAPPATAKPKTPVLDLDSIAELGTTQPPTPSHSGPPPPASA